MGNLAENSPLFDFLEKILCDKAKGKKWLDNFTGQLSMFSKLDYCLVGKVEGKVIESISFSNKNNLLRPISCPLGETTIITSYQKNTHYYTSDLVKEYPDHILVKEMGIKSLLSEPLRSISGDLLGSVCLFSKERVPEEDILMDRKILMILIGRIEAELEVEFERSKMNQAGNELESLISLIDSAVVHAGQDGIISSINKSGAKLLGYEVSELIGKNVSILMPSPHKESHDGYIRDFLETGIAKMIGKPREFKVLKKNGEEFPALIKLQQVRVGAKKEFLAMIMDLSEQKQMEKMGHMSSKLAMIG